MTIDSRIARLEAAISTPQTIAIATLDDGDAQRQFADAFVLAVPGALRLTITIGENVETSELRLFRHEAALEEMGNA